MDVYFKLEDEVFVWNGEKAVESRRKHGVRFEQACEVFYDRSVLFVDASIATESRSAAIGYAAQNDILFVVHIELERGVLRIISARPANNREISLYEDGE